MADDPPKQPPETNPPSREPTQQRNEPAPAPRTELQIPESVIAHYQSWQDKQNRREYLRILVEILTLAAVVAYAIIAGVQADQMRRATEAAHKSAEAAAKANALAEDGFRNSSRAYITIVNEPGLRETESQVPKVGITFFATGNAPALKVRKGIAWDIRELPLPPSDADYLGDPAYQPEVFTLLRPQTEELITEVNLTPADRQKIETPNFGLVVWGTVEYTTFDKIHHTRFCYIMRPNLKLPERRCPVHNGDD